jgi:hypothetical protein
MQACRRSVKWLQGSILYRKLQILGCLWKLTYQLMRLKTRSKVQSRLGGVMVSVLATGPKGHGFKPGRGDWILRAIKIRSTPSFGGGLKPVPCRKILLHVKDPLRNFRYWYAKFSLLRPFLLLAPDVSAGTTARELWWTSQELSPSLLSTLTYHLRNEQEARWWPRF